MEARRLFWLKVFRGGALFVLVTGIIPSLAVNQAWQEPWRIFFDILTWPIDGSPQGFSNPERQLSAVLGGVLCGWAWLLYRLARPEVFNPAIRKIMVQSVWVWFVLDSGGSILSGLPLNAVSNVVFLLTLLVPLTQLSTET